MNYIIFANNQFVIDLTTNQQDFDITENITEELEKEFFCDSNKYAPLEKDVGLYHEYNGVIYDYDDKLHIVENYAILGPKIYRKQIARVLRAIEYYNKHRGDDKREMFILNTLDYYLSKFDKAYTEYLSKRLSKQGIETSVKDIQLPDVKIVFFCDDANVVVSRSNNILGDIIWTEEIFDKDKTYILGPASTKVAAFLNNVREQDIINMGILKGCDISNYATNVILETARLLSDTGSETTESMFVDFDIEKAETGEILSEISVHKRLDDEEKQKALNTIRLSLGY